MGDEKLFFLDFEASSRGGWPIEIGLSWIRDEQVETWSSLIRPQPAWSDSAWTPQAELVHGIPRAALDAARPVAEVADAFWMLVGNAIVVSDAPLHDGAWLAQLLDAPPEVHNYHDLAFRRFSAAALDYLYERLERSKPPHRAGPDSARLAKAWLRAVSIEDEVK